MSRIPTMDGNCDILYVDESMCEFKLLNKEGLRKLIIKSNQKGGSDGVDMLF